MLDIPAVPIPRHSPRVSSAHIIGEGQSRALLAVDSGRIYRPEVSLLNAIDESMAFGDEERVREFLASSGLLWTEHPCETVPTAVPLRAISLSIASKCNLGCTYCYAEQGDFGGSSRPMSLDVARKAIDQLVAGASPGERVRIVFLGGEPLVNRTGLREATKYAKRVASERGVRVDLAITTNATLLTVEDAEFLDQHAFAITISVDGIGEAHDRLRPSRSGRGTYQRVVERARLLLGRGGRQCQVAARLSVTPSNLDLPETLTELTSIGFDSIQFAPVLAAPSGRGTLDAADLERLLAQLVACSDLCEKRLAESGAMPPFANLSSTLARIHRRALDEYPCGAGGSYVGVSSEGTLSACHRFVGDAKADLGNVEDGLDPALQADWLSQRNVRFQKPCRSCWARNLCGGSCHYDVINRGRPACDYIRGWLDHCLVLYVRLAIENPGMLSRMIAPRAIGVG